MSTKHQRSEGKSRRRRLRKPKLDPAPGLMIPRDARAVEAARNGILLVQQLGQWGTPYLALHDARDGRIVGCLFPDSGVYEVLGRKGRTTEFVNFFRQVGEQVRAARGRD